MTTATLLPRLSGSAFGIACALGSAVFFSFNDLGMKWLSGDYPLHQITFIRGIAAVALTLVILMPLEGGFANLRTNHPWLHLWRGFLVITSNMAIYTSVATLPLGEAVALFFVAPLFITAMSVVFLGEKVGVHRWTAVAIGFLGVMVMMRPGTDGFEWAMLLPVLSALLYAALQISTRIIGIRERASTLSFYMQAQFVVFSGATGLLVGGGQLSGTGNANLEFLARAWVWPGVQDFAIIAGMGVAVSIAGYLVSQAYRTTVAATIAPFEYVAMPIALFWSAAIWAEYPDLFDWIGIVLIAGSGLYVFMRERIRATDSAPPT